MRDIPAVAFLFDVDNTLLDHDAVKRELTVQLDVTVHTGASGEYWQHDEALRDAPGHSDAVVHQRHCAHAADHTRGCHADGAFKAIGNMSAVAPSDPMPSGAVQESSARD